MKTVKRGAKGGNVKTLQTALNKAGAKPELKVDGIFGPKTEAATKSFQKRKKLTADGIAGPVTLFSLGLVKEDALEEWPLDTPDSIYFITHEISKGEAARRERDIADIRAMGAPDAKAAEKEYRALGAKMDKALEDLRVESVIYGGVHKQFLEARRVDKRKAEAFVRDGRASAKRHAKAMRVQFGHYMKMREIAERARKVKKAA